MINKSIRKLSILSPHYTGRFWVESFANKTHYSFQGRQGRYVKISLSKKGSLSYFTH
jgi:hypothetical protein